MPGASVNAGNASLGPCNIALNGVTLGATNGPVVVSLEETLVAWKTHQTGETPQKFWGKGHVAAIRASLMEVTVSNIEAVLGATTTTGVTKGGYAEVAQAKTAVPLVLTPLDTGAPFGALTFPKVVPRVSGDQGLFGGEAGNSLNVEFLPQWDTATGCYFKFGGIDVTPPSLNSSTPGNGTTIAFGGTTTFTFSEVLGAGSVHGGNVLLHRDATTTTYSCTVSLVSDVITAYPAASLVTAQTMVWALTNITDQAGNKIAAPVFVNVTVA